MGQESRAIRRHDIDFIRVVVFAMLMIYHTSLIFGTHTWLLHADIPSRSFDLISLASHPWRISLLFLVSGVTTAALAKRLSPGDIRGMRSRQLIPPLLFGIFVLIPPQIFAAMKSGFGLEMSYLDFWATYLRFGTVILPNGAPTSLFSLQHLWFIAYLWLYTLLLTLCLVRGGGLAHADRDAAVGAAVRSRPFCLPGCLSGGAAAGPLSDLWRNLGRAH
jgi:glucans biosynthesis protein C